MSKIASITLAAVLAATSLALPSTANAAVRLEDNFRLQCMTDYPFESREFINRCTQQQMTAAYEMVSVKESFGSLSFAQRFAYIHCTNGAGAAGTPIGLFAMDFVAYRNCYLSKAGAMAPRAGKAKASRARPVTGGGNR
jgi:hypothetical protein